jgi:hypothetical protein
MQEGRLTFAGFRTFEEKEEVIPGQGVFDRLIKWFLVFYEGKTWVGEGDLSVLVRHIVGSWGRSINEALHHIRKAS